MGINQINIYQENSRIVNCFISQSNVSLDGYETYFVVKEKRDGSIVFANTGSLTLMSGSYTGSYIIDSTDTDVTPDVYYYEVIAESGSYKYTIIQDNLVITDSIVY